jgi:hypothetical protein
VPRVAIGETMKLAITNGHHVAAQAHKFLAVGARKFLAL